MQFSRHQEVLRLRRTFESSRDALADDAFIEKLWETLRAWGMHSRAAKLRPVKEFGANLRVRAEAIAVFDNKSIDDPDIVAEEIAKQLWNLLSGLQVSMTMNPVVVGTKTLHHLLPDLIPPMDRTYTQTFFHWDGPAFQYIPQQVFTDIYIYFVHMARRANPGQYVGDGWRTSKTKVLDNAVIGYCCWHNLLGK